MVTVADTAAHYNAIITQNVNLRRWLSTSAESNGIADAGTEVTVIGSVVMGDGDRFLFHHLRGYACGRQGERLCAGGMPEARHGDQARASDGERRVDAGFRLRL